MSYCVGHAMPFPVCDGAAVAGEGSLCAGVMQAWYDGKDKSKALVIPLWQAPITSASHHKEDPRCASKYSAKEQKG